MDQVRVDQGAMTMKGYSTFPKAPALLEPQHQIVLCHIQDTYLEGGSYLSVEMQLVYFPAATDWAFSVCELLSKMTISK